MESTLNSSRLLWAPASFQLGQWCFPDGGTVGPVAIGLRMWKRGAPGLDNVDWTENTGWLGVRTPLLGQLSCSAGPSPRASPKGSCSGGQERPSDPTRTPPDSTATQVLLSLRLMQSGSRSFILPNGNRFTLIALSTFRGKWCYFLFFF